ncbi:hypothetical protein MBLNU13_g00638t1 [Cladosporium sp. NU13]
MHARRRRLDRVSSPRPPSARQAPKLNKGSPLPRQRTPSLLSRHDDLTCSVFLADDDDDDDDDQQERRRPSTIGASTTIDDIDDIDDDDTPSLHPDLTPP